MSTERIDPQPYLKVLSLAALLGVFSAVITFVFLVIVELGQSLIWEQVAHAVGVLVKVFGDRSGILPR
jgi:hypothetical protein